LVAFARHETQYNVFSLAPNKFHFLAVRLHDDISIIVAHNRRSICATNIAHDERARREIKNGDLRHR
jgi:hypothetical protein